jgi:hypothetical protein
MGIDMARDPDKEAELDLLSVLEPKKAFADDYPHKRGKYRLEMCDALTEFMAYGHTFHGATGRLGVTRTTADRWLKVHPDFAEAKELGEQLRLYRLERVLNYSATGEAHPLDEANWIEIIKDQRLNFPALMFSLKTVHKDQYSEKVITEDISVSSDVEKPKEVLNAEIAKQLDTLSRSIEEGADTSPKIGSVGSIAKASESSSKG